MKLELLIKIPISDSPDEDYYPEEDVFYQVMIMYDSEAIKDGYKTMTSPLKRLTGKPYYFYEFCISVSNNYAITWKLPVKHLSVDNYITDSFIYDSSRYAAIAICSIDLEDYLRTYYCTIKEVPNET